MYSETFGIQNPSAEVELCAQWVQWANTGIMNGASDNETDIRWNLTQFWNEKAAAYSGEDQQGQQNLDRLDTYAHSIWNALETGKIYSASPGYWSYWKAYLFGGTPSNPSAYAAASAAAAASAGEQKAAAATGGAFGANVSTLAAGQAAALPTILAGSQGFWTQAGVLPSPLGIPLWAWAVGAVGLYLVVKR